MFYLSTIERSDSSSSGSSGSGSGSSDSGNSSSSSGSGDSCKEKQEKIARLEKEAARLAKLAKHSRPIYEDYMPTSPVRRYPESDSDNESSPPNKRTKHAVSESENSAGEEVSYDDNISQTNYSELLELRDKLNSAIANAAKKESQGDDKKKGSESVVAKEAKVGGSKNKEDKRSVQKKEDQKAVKTIRYKNTPTNDNSPRGLTFKKRKALQSQLNQLVKVTAKVIDIAKDA